MRNTTASESRGGSPRTRSWQYASGSSTDSSTDDLTAARRRRLAAVPPDELPLGEDAIDLVTEDPVETVVPDSLGSEAPVEAYLDDEAAVDDT